MCDWYTGLNCYSKHVSDREDIIQTSILINLVSEKLYYCFPRSCIYKSFNWCDFILRYAKLRLKFTYKRYCPFLIFFLNASKFLNFQSHADSQTKIAILYRIIKRRKKELSSFISHILIIVYFMKSDYRICFVFVFNLICYFSFLVQRTNLAVEMKYVNQCWLCFKSHF